MLYISYWPYSKIQLQCMIKLEGNVSDMIPPVSLKLAVMTPTALKPMCFSGHLSTALRQVLNIIIACSVVCQWADRFTRYRVQILDSWCSRVPRPTADLFQCFGNWGGVDLLPSHFSVSTMSRQCCLSLLSADLIWLFSRTLVRWVYKVQC